MINSNLQMENLVASSSAHARAATETMLEANKKAVLDFNGKAINESDYEAAVAHLGPHYIQHNPAIGDGVDGFRRFMRDLRQRFPHVCGDIKRIVADGNYVILHAHARRAPDEPGLAIVDILRPQAGKIAEHWDVHQSVPEESSSSNGMF